MASFDWKIALGYNWRPNYSLLFYDFAMEPIIKSRSKIIKLTGIDNSWFQINHNSTWNVLACTGWWEKGWEWVIFFSYRSLGNLKKRFTSLLYFLLIPEIHVDFTGVFVKFLRKFTYGTIWSDSVLHTVELPAGVTHLNTSLANMNGNDFSHFC